MGMYAWLAVAVMTVTEEKVAAGHDCHFGLTYNPATLPPEIVHDWRFCVSAYILTAGQVARDQYGWFGKNYGPEDQNMANTGIRECYFLDEDAPEIRYDGTYVHYPNEEVQAFRPQMERDRGPALDCRRSAGCRWWVALIIR